LVSWKDQMRRMGGDPHAIGLESLVLRAFTFGRPEHDDGPRGGQSR